MNSTFTVRLENDVLVFTEKIPTLQELASFNIARPLWYSILMRETPDEDFVNGSTALHKQLYETIVLEEIAYVIEQLNVPQPIKKIIKDSCHHVRKEIGHWISDTEYYVADVYKINNSYLNCCVWKWNVHIDDEKSARKMISRPDLNQVQKFKIMCRFCWQNEIESLSPDVELEQFMENFANDPDSFGRNPFLYYWICKLKNNLRMISFSGDYSSLEMFMFCQRKKYTLASIEYFWNFLNTQDQITAAARMIKNNFRMKNCHNLILSKLDEFQLSSIISEIPGTIMTRFLSHSSNLDAARFVWNRVKNSLNVGQFSTLMTEMVEKLCQHNFYSFVIELWNTADDQLKHNFLYDEDKKYIEELFFHYQPGCVLDFIDVLFAVLSYSSPTYRRDMILENGDVLLIAYSNYSEVNRIIKFCLPNSNDITQFKELVKNSPYVKEQFAELFRSGCFSSLTELLVTFFPKESILKDIMKQILNVDVDKNFEFDIFIFQPSAWSDLNELLRVVYGNDKFPLKRIKQELILWFKWNDEFDVNIERLNHWRNAINDLIDDMTELNGITKVIEGRV